MEKALPLEWSLYGIAVTTVADFTPGSPPTMSEPRPIVKGAFRVGVGVFSPDGKWIAYDSEEDGSSKIYVRPFPSGAPRIQVSAGYGQQPRWSRKHEEIFYQSGDRTIHVAPLTIRGGGFIAGTPAQWSAVRPAYFGGSPTFDVFPDGESTVVLEAGSTGPSSHSHLVFVFNLLDEIRRKLP